MKECIIYAIDCRPSMFEQDKHGQVPVAKALKSIRSKLLDKIKSRPNDQSAIVLFGTVWIKTKLMSFYEANHFFELEREK